MGPSASPTLAPVVVEWISLANNKNNSDGEESPSASNNNDWELQLIGIGSGVLVVLVCVLCAVFIGFVYMKVQNKQEIQTESNLSTVVQKTQEDKKDINDEIPDAI